MYSNTHCTTFVHALRKALIKLQDNKQDMMPHLKNLASMGFNMEVLLKAE